MTGLVFTEKIVSKFIRGKGEAGSATEKQRLMINASDNDDLATVQKKSSGLSPLVFMLGVVVSIMGGVFGAIQYGVITEGHTQARQSQIT